MNTIEIHINSKEIRDDLLELLESNLARYKEAYTFASDVDRSISKKYSEMVQAKSMITTQKELMIDLISKLCVSYGNTIEEMKRYESILKNNLANSMVLPFDKDYLFREVSRAEIFKPISRIQRGFYE